MLIRVTLSIQGETMKGRWVDVQGGDRRRRSNSSGANLLSDTPLNLPNPELRFLPQSEIEFECIVRSRDWLYHDLAP